MSPLPLYRSPLLPTLCAVLALALPGLAQADEPLLVGLHGVVDLLGSPVAQPTEPAGSQVDEAALALRVREAMGEETWQRPGTAVAGAFGALLVVHPAEVHRAVRQLLDGWREERQHQQLFRVVLARHQSGLLAEPFLAAAQPLHEAGARPALVLGADQADALEARLDEKGAIVDRMTLAATPDTPGSWSRGIETSYVQDLEVHMVKGLTASVPIVEVARQGYHLELATDGSAPPGATHIRLHLELATLESMEPYTTTAGTIELPSQVVQETEQEVVLDQDHALVLAGLVDPFPLHPLGRGRARSGENLLLQIRPLPRPAPGPPGASPLPAWLTDPAEQEKRRLPDSFGEPALRLLDVRDLLAGFQDYVAPDLGLMEEETTEEAPGVVQVDTEAAGKALAAWITDHIAPDSWHAPETLASSARGTLVIRHDEAMQRLVTLVLADLRRAAEILIMLEVRLLQVADGSEARMEGEGLRVGGRLFPWGLVGSPELIVQAAERRSSGLSVLTAPRLTSYPGQRASIVVANQTSYVSGMSIQYQEDETGEVGAILCDPQVDVLQDGISLETRALPTPDGSEILLNLTLEQSETLRPIRARDVPMGAATASIQLPACLRASAQRSLSLPSGATLLLASPDLSREDSRAGGSVMLVTARVVSLDEEFGR